MRGEGARLEGIASCAEKTFVVAEIDGVLTNLHAVTPRSLRNFAKDRGLSERFLIFRSLHFHVMKVIRDKQNENSLG